MCHYVLKSPHDGAVACMDVCLTCIAVTGAQGSVAWKAAAERLHAALERVTALTDAQTAHQLLRKCLDGCKVNHLLRSSDSYACEAHVQACDSAIMGAFEDIALVLTKRRRQDCP